MKSIKPITLVFATLAFVAVLFGIARAIGQESPPAPLSQFTVLTNPTNYLSATSLRMTFEDVNLHPTTGKPIISVNLEAWAEEEDGGVTNNVIIRRVTLRMTTAQLNAWNASTNGFLFLQNAMLNRAKLTLRTE